LNTIIHNAYFKRDLANEYLNNAQLLVLKSNNLPLFSNAEIETIDPNCEVEIKKLTCLSSLLILG